MIMNFHKNYFGLCIEFKLPTNKYQVSDAQKEMKKRYKKNCYYFILSNDNGHIAKEIYTYMAGVRIPCKYCEKSFLSKETRKTHYEVILRITKKVN